MPATAMMPIAPVRATCVPPQAETSKSSTSISRSAPVRADSLRSGSGARFVGVDEADRDRPVLPDDPVRLVLGARRSRPAVTSRARSIVDDAAPR